MKECMNETLQDLMRSATRLTQAGQLREATEALQRALRGAGSFAPPAAGQPKAPPQAHAGHGPGAEAQSLVLDGCVFEVESSERPPAQRSAAPAPPSGSQQAWGGQVFGEVHARETAIGAFTSASHTHAALSRHYKLYVPPGHVGRLLALVVMLHGCTQDPDDFAAGTGMNERAREQGFCVLYPAQAADANPSRCWNWFKHNHQRREGGEAALLADLTQAIMRQQGIAPGRVYIAGLSAGGAMAATVAGLFPELFAAVGVHSGLPGGAAHNLPEALAAMKSGAASMPPLDTRRHGPTSVSASAPRQCVPTIVFHGDQDRTVHPRNAEQLVAAALGSGAALDQSNGQGAGTARVEQGVSVQGRRYTRTTHLGERGNTQAELWLVHGAGHAWSGGCPEGSYTDAKGPDATREMLRFFFAQGA